MYKAEDSEANMEALFFDAAAACLASTQAHILFVSVGGHLRLKPVESTLQNVPPVFG